MVQTFSQSYQIQAKAVLIKRQRDKEIEKIDILPPYHILDMGKPVPFHRGQRLAFDSTFRTTAIIAGTQSGKGIIISAMIPTPDGFQKLSELSVGDNIFGADGLAYPITYISPVHHLKCYKITFSDGSSNIFDEEHLWLVQSRKQRKNQARRMPENSLWIENRPQCRPTEDYLILRTDEIYNTYLLPPKDKRRSHPTLNYSIDLPEPVNYPVRNLLIPPYVLGAWLGDGTSRSAQITIGDDLPIVDKIKRLWGTIEKRSYNSRTDTYNLGTHKENRGKFLNLLREYNLVSNKHIPEIYLISSLEQRLELLRGLLDTDGYIDEHGYIEFANTNKVLAEGVCELVRSLGILARIQIGQAKLYGRIISDKYRICFTTTLPVFSLDRKLARIQERKTPETRRLFISHVEIVESVPTECISVDSPDNLYLVGRSYTPTHNTVFGPIWLRDKIAEMGSGDYIAVTSSYDLFKLKLLPSFLEVFDLLNLGRFWAGDKIYEMRDPQTGLFRAVKSTDPMYARVILRSAQALGGLESSTANAAWLDEAGQDDFPLAAYKAVRRRLSISRGPILITTTLYNLGWLKQIVIDPAEKEGVKSVERIDAGELEYTDNPGADIRLIQFDSIINPKFTVAEFEEQRRLLPDDEFMMQYRGRVAKLRFLVYDSFDKKTGTCPRFDVPTSWIRYIGLDFGGIHTAVLFYAEHPQSGILYCYREYMEGNKTAKEHTNSILSGEPGIPIACGGSKSEGQWRHEFALGGLPIHPPPFPEVKLGITLVYALHKRNAIIYFDDLEGVLDEKGRYKRLRDKAGNQTDEIENKSMFHFMDAERYVVSWLVGGEIELEQTIYNPPIIGDW